MENLTKDTSPISEISVRRTKNNNFSFNKQHKKLFAINANAEFWYSEFERRKSFLRVAIVLSSNESLDNYSTKKRKNYFRYMQIWNLFRVHQLLLLDNLAGSH